MLDSYRGPEESGADPEDRADWLEAIALAHAMRGFQKAAERVAGLAGSYRYFASLLCLVCRETLSTQTTYHNGVEIKSETFCPACTNDELWRLGRSVGK